MDHTTTILSWNGNVYFGKKYLTCEPILVERKQKNRETLPFFRHSLLRFVYLSHYFLFYYNDNRKYLENENCFYSRQSTENFINDVNIIISTLSHLA